MLVACCPLYSLGSQKHVFPGVELRGVGVLPAQVLCRRLGWELRFTDVPEVPSQVNGFTCEQDRGTSAPCQHQCERELGTGNFCSITLLGLSSGRTGALPYLSGHPRALPTFISCCRNATEFLNLICKAIILCGPNEPVPALKSRWVLPLLLFTRA